MINVSLLLRVGEQGLESTSDFLVASLVAIRFLAWEKGGEMGESHIILYTI